MIPESANHGLPHRSHAPLRADQRELDSYSPCVYNHSGNCDVFDAHVTCAEVNFLDNLCAFMSDFDKR